MANELKIIEQQFIPLLPHMAKSLPPSSGIGADRILQSALIAFEKTPDLMTCDRLTLQQSIFSACATGLLVDGITGQGYIVKYGSKAQFLTGVKGYGTIAARSGFTLGGNLIYEGEEYDIVLGSGGYARVKFDPTKRFPGARIVAAYATMESNSAPSLVDAMSLDEILDIKKISKATYRGNPWEAHFGQMATKTVKRRVGKSAPVDVLHRAIALDDAVDQGHHAFFRPDDGALMIDHVAAPISRTQPEPTHEFTVNPIKYTMLDATGKAHDLGSLDNWRRIILDRVMPMVGAQQIEDFLDRNKPNFDAIAERHAEAVAGVRAKLSARIYEIKNPQ